MAISMIPRPKIFPILQMPLEVLLEILLIVKALDTYPTPAKVPTMLSLVCRVWNNMVNANGCFWAHIPSSYPSQRVENMLTRSMQAPLFVTIDTSHIASAGVLLRHTSRFRSLNLTLSGRISIIGPHAAPDLRILALHMRDLHPSMRTTPWLASWSIPDVRQLLVSCAHFSAIIHLIQSSLVSVRLEFITFKTLGEFYSLLKTLASLPHLNSLQLIHCLPPEFRQELEGVLVRFAHMQDMLLVDSPAACLWLCRVVSLPTGFFPTCIFTSEASERARKDLSKQLATAVFRQGIKDSEPPPVGAVAIDGLRLTIWPPADICGCTVKPFIDITFSLANKVTHIAAVARPLPLNGATALRLIPNHNDMLWAQGWYDISLAVPNVTRLICGNTPLKVTSYALAFCPADRGKPTFLFPRLKDVIIRDVRYNLLDGKHGAQEFIKMLVIRRQRNSGIRCLEIRDTTLFYEVDILSMLQHVGRVAWDGVECSVKIVCETHWPGLQEGVFS